VGLGVGEVDVCSVWQSFCAAVWNGHGLYRGWGKGGDRETGRGGRGRRREEKNGSFLTFFSSLSLSLSFLRTLEREREREREIKGYI
jgi:hypothetical protein